MGRRLLTGVTMGNSTKREIRLFPMFLSKEMSIPNYLAGL